MKFESPKTKQWTNELYSSIKLSAIANNYQMFRKFYIWRKNIYIFFELHYQKSFLNQLTIVDFLMFHPFVC